MNEDARVFANGIEQDRVAKLSDHFADDVNRFRLERFKVSPVFGNNTVFHCCGFTCNPHSFAPVSSHHQRPARNSCPGSIARVQGAQPMLGYPRSWSALYGTLFSLTYAQTSSSVQSSSGLNLRRRLASSHSSIFNSWRAF